MYGNSTTTRQLADKARGGGTVARVTGGAVLGRAESLVTGDWSASKMTGWAAAGRLGASPRL
jgi:hypothetical protein